MRELPVDQIAHRIAGELGAKTGLLCLISNGTHRASTVKIPIRDPLQLSGT